MAAVKDLIAVEADGSISFGNNELDEKAKKSDFEVRGDLYKVKTFRGATRLERNDAMVYESYPGTVVWNFAEDEQGVSFTLESEKDCQVVLGLTDGAAYKVVINGNDAGVMDTVMGGKLVLSVEVDEDCRAEIRVIRV